MATPDDQIRILRWYTPVWVLLGPAPEFAAGLTDPAGTRIWSLAVPIALGLAGAVAALFPGHRPWFPYALVAGLGVVALLRDGAASLYVVSLPYFWVPAGTARRSVLLSGAGALAAVAGGALSGHPAGGNAIVTAVACAAGAALGLAAQRTLARSDERARRLAGDLATTQAELAEAYRRQGADAERERLAREIHDTLAQGFASIVVLAEAVRSGLTTDPDGAARQLLSIERTARENLAEARALVGSSPAPGTGAESGSIARTLGRVLDRFAEDTGLTVDAELDDVDCDPAARIALLRCTQESLANVRKHAAASTVGVVLTRQPHGVELEITDDGQGFTVGATGGFGLAGMRRRLTDLGGDLTITSSPGDGTRVLVVLPTEE
ncbi:sensor histidine kinase [Actinoallomurus spadix]|uniref:Oxygen sensor histidine kinase NreB n=1 Tax=Actinoallomurus spadix TaxID=79912 RepID=A0ABN0WSG6_9ACTN|nr:sensor histidine kinase [Actinoallomurus spadix]MCO5990128.1 sensor histidine kinase [Actinoallomurus spadix]